MHFLETYALNCGLKIDSPYIFQKYYPLPCESYITFSYSNYEYYQDVIDIIFPKLKERNIEIVYIKNKNDEIFDLCHEIQEIDYSESAFLISKSLLHFGEPTFFSDLASHYDLKTVTIYSNAYPQNICPYWNQEKDLRVQASGTPAFDPRENHAVVNSIKPEDIAKQILTALDIEYDYEYKTVHIGQFYYRNDIAMEIVPDKNPPILMENENRSIRMDLNFDEEYLYNILKIQPHQIWTDKAINKDILRALAKQIQQIFYIIPKDDDPSFVKTLNELSIHHKLVSFLEEKELSLKKLDYTDSMPIIDLKSNRSKQIEDLKELGINSLFYSSCKIIYDGGLYYPSEHARQNMMAIDEPFKVCKFEESDTLFKDLPFFKVLRKLD
jgi:hypothetical protein